MNTTTMNTKEMIEVMQAFEDGKKIEFRERGSRTWKPDENPEWDWSGIEYRIAPEPEPKKEGRWERKAIRIDDGDYVLKRRRNGWLSLASLSNIPGFGGIEYQSPFDPKVTVRSMVPLMFDYRDNTSYMASGDCNSDGESSGFGSFDRPGIPVAAWFWQEE